MFRTRFQRLAGGLLALVVVCSSGTPSFGAASHNVFADLARELLDDLKFAPTAGFKIAIWPYQAEDVPIPLESAWSLNDQLLAALLKISSNRFEFVGRRELRQVIKDRQESGDSIDDVLRTVTRNVKADILIIGTMGLGERGTASIGYKAVGASGTLLAVTKPYPIEITPGGSSVSLAQGLKRAARSFANHAPDLTNLRLGGVRFQTSGIQTELGSYIEQKLADEVVTTFSNVLTGRKIIVRRSQLTGEQLNEMRGKQVPASAVKRKRFEDKSGVYVLEGRYWDFGEAVDLRLSLRDARDRVTVWTGRVVPPSHLQKRPPGNFPPALTENDGLGPFQFTLTTDRGDNPVYRIGDKLNLIVLTEIDAWLYCYYFQADGQVVQIFPNQYHTEAKIAGGVVHTIPGDLNEFKFDLTFGDPSGIELVKCFAVQQDVAGKIPMAFKAPLTPHTPAHDMYRLPEVFRSVPEMIGSETSIVLSVERI